jgi:hypothetical protein
VTVVAVEVEAGFEMVEPVAETGAGMDEAIDAAEGADAAGVADAATVADARDAVTAVDATDEKLDEAADVGVDGVDGEVADVAVDGMTGQACPNSAAVLVEDSCLAEMLEGVDCSASKFGWRQTAYTLADCSGHRY